MFRNLLDGTAENISWVSDGISKLLLHSMAINSCVYGDIQNLDIKMSNLNAIIFHTSFDTEHTKLYIDTIYKFIWTNRSHTDEEKLEFDTHYSFFMDEYASLCEKSKSRYSFPITSAIERILQLS